MASVGENIYKRRKELGMTQEELARKIGYKSKSSINKIEIGRNDLPQRKILQFAEALLTTPGALMGWVEEDQAKKNDKLAELIVKMRADNDFYNVVAALSDLPAEQYESIKGLLVAFTQK